MRIMKKIISVLLVLLMVFLFGCDNKRIEESILPGTQASESPSASPSISPSAASAFVLSRAPSGRPGTNAGIRTFSDDEEAILILTKTGMHMAAWNIDCLITPFFRFQVIFYDVDFLCFLIGSNQH